MLINLEIQETHKELFQKTVEYLLANTFILRDKEENLYKFVANKSNWANINDYLQILNYAVHVNEDMQIAMIYPLVKEDEPRRFTTLQLKAQYSRLLLLLAKIYYEKYTAGEKIITVTMRELTDQIAGYKFNTPAGEKNWLDNGLTLLRRYNFVDYNQRETGEDKLITIYGTIRLLLGDHIDQFRENLEKYKNIFNTEEETDDYDDDDDEIAVPDFFEEE